MSFPVSPTDGQTTTVNNIRYIYSSSNNSWKRIGPEEYALIDVTARNTANAAFAKANTPSINNARTTINAMIFGG